MATVHENLATHFINLGLPKEASQWLIMLYDMIQFLDDVKDGDPISDDSFNSNLWNFLINFPLNPFYQLHSATLAPLIAVNILKWKTSNILEQDKNVSPVSFVWRAGYYEIVLMCVGLCFSHEVDNDKLSYVANMYGEKLENYLEEFNHA